MVESLFFPDDLAECHRLMAQQQALLVVLDQQATEQHLFEMSSVFTEPQSSAEQSAGDVPAIDEEAARAAQEKAARRRKKRADRKLCLDALPQIDHLEKCIAVPCCCFR